MERQRNPGFSREAPMIVSEWETASPDFASLHPGYKICSQLPSTALAKLDKSLIGKSVELAGFRISFDLPVEAGGIEFIEPSAKFREFVGAQFGNRSFDLFDLAHAGKTSMGP